MSNPTSNFGWQMPTSTDLVTDLPADFEVFGQAVDTDFVDLLGGTTGQILSKTSATDLDFTWVSPNAGDITGVTAGTGISGGGTSGTVTVTNSMATEITAKADLIVGTGNAAFDNLPVGTDGHVLTADSTVSPTGLKWAAPAGGGKVLQVVQTVKTDTFTSTSTSFADITGLSVSITPSSATSKVLVLASFMLSGTSGLYLVIARLLRDSTPIFKGDTAGTRSEGFFNNIPPDNNGGGFGNIAFLDSPATTSPTTYKIQGLGTVSGGVTTWYLNRTANDNNNVSGLRGASSIIAMEIGA
jgi:hypothetical protein